MNIGECAKHPGQSLFNCPNCRMDEFNKTHNFFDRSQGDWNLKNKFEMELGKEPTKNPEPNSSQINPYIEQELKDILDKIYKNKHNLDTGMISLLKKISEKRMYVPLGTVGSEKE